MPNCKIVLFYENHRHYNAINLKTKFLHELKEDGYNKYCGERHNNDVQIRYFYQQDLLRLNETLNITPKSSPNYIKLLDEIKEDTAVVDLYKTIKAEKINFIPMDLPPYKAEELKAEIFPQLTFFQQLSSSLSFWDIKVSIREKHMIDNINKACEKEGEKIIVENGFGHYKTFDDLREKGHNVIGFYIHDNKYQSWVEYLLANYLSYCSNPDITEINLDNVSEADALSILRNNLDISEHSNIILEDSTLSQQKVELVGEAS